MLGCLGLIVLVIIISYITNPDLAFEFRLFYGFLMACWYWLVRFISSLIFGQNAEPSRFRSRAEVGLAIMLTFSTFEVIIAALDPAIELEPWFLVAIIGTPVVALIAVLVRSTLNRRNADSIWYLAGRKIGSARYHRRTTSESSTSSQEDL